MDNEATNEEDKVGIGHPLKHYSQAIAAMKFAPHILGAALCSAPFVSAFAPTTHHALLPKTARPPSPPTTSTRLHSSTSPSPPSASVNNVVLSPSTSDPSAFDSYAIGTPRVHRYLRDTASTTDEAEYVMWYHGRCTNLNSAENNLPPLSTGRIGRATSRNGLVWTKCEVGSGSEASSPPGVSLGLNEESWWNFDTSHVGKISPGFE